MLLKYNVEQFYLFAPAEGWWNPCSVIVVIHLKKVRIHAVSAVDFGLLTVQGETPVNITRDLSIIQEQTSLKKV